MKRYYLLYIVALALLLGCLVGCTRYVRVLVPYQVNNTIYTNITVQNNTVSYVNITAPCNHQCNVTDTGARYTLDLIRQLKQCEDNIIEDWNLTECVWKIESLNQSLNQCNQSLNEIKDLLD